MSQQGEADWGGGQNGEQRAKGSDASAGAQPPLTCSVQEFAAIVGIGRDHAYELVHSDFPPPGFKLGKGYRIIRSRISEYIDQLYERELAARSRRR